MMQSVIITIGISSPLEDAALVEIAKKIIEIAWYDTNLFRGY